MRKEAHVAPVDPEARRRQREAIRRPITEEEARALEAFGAALRISRKAAGLTQTGLSRAAGYSDQLAYRLEAAIRRPRLSTIERLVEVIVAYAPFLDGAQLVKDLVRLAGCGLAPESQYRERVERRREARLEERRRRDERSEALRQRAIAERVKEAQKQRREQAQAKIERGTRAKDQVKRPKRGGSA